MFWGCTGMLKSRSSMEVQDFSQEGKKLCVLYELGNKTQLGAWGYCELLKGFSSGARYKGFEKPTTFSLKLV